MNVCDEDRQRLLSPEELLALAEDDYDPAADNAAALAEIGRGNLDADDDDDQADGGAAPAGKPADTATTEKPSTAAPAAAPPPAAPADAAAGEAGADDLAGKPADAPAPGPEQRQPTGYKVELPADFDDQLKANKTSVSELRQKLNDGELDQAEHDAALDQLQDKREELLELRARARISAEMRQQADSDNWIAAINTFVADAGTKAELGIVDYKSDAAKQADLDALVKVLAKAPGNENKSSRWFLEEAHKRVVALHGVPTTKKPDDIKRKPDVTEVVQNLADVPGGAGDADPASSEFAELDRLTGAAYERALAALSPDKRTNYLMSA